MENTAINTFMQLLLEQGLSVLVQILCAVVLATATVCLSWLAAKIKQTKGFAGTGQATWELRDAVETTVLELQKTTVDSLKAAAADGKLTAAEIQELHHTLIDKTVQKMSTPALKLLEKAGVDIRAKILGVGEEILKRMELEDKRLQEHTGEPEPVEDFAVPPAE